MPVVKRKSVDNYRSNGIGLITSNNGNNKAILTTQAQVQRLIKTNPSQLLPLLVEVHPSLSHALFTAKRLMWSGDFTLTAYNKSGKINTNKTKEIEELWEKALPFYIEGITGLLDIFTEEIMIKGMIAVENVAGKGLDGIAQICPIDSATVYFRRIDEKSPLKLYQYQEPNGLSFFRGNFTDPFLMNYQELNVENTFVLTIDQTLANPNGRAPYGTATNEVLRDFEIIQDLTDAIHNTAFPRIHVGVNLSNLHKVAVDVYHMTNPTKAADWVDDQLRAMRDYVSDLYSDDNIVSDSSGDIKVLQPGDFNGVKDVLSFLRQRIIQSLKTLPTLIGVNDGSTFNYTSVEWQIYAQSLEKIRSLISKIICRIAEYHLRLQGVLCDVRATYTKIKTNDELVEANTENIRLVNAEKRLALGWTTEEEECLRFTGHKPAGIKTVIDPTTPDVSGKIPNHPNSEGVPKNNEKFRFYD